MGDTEQCQWESYDEYGQVENRDLRLYHPGHQDHFTKESAAHIFQVDSVKEESVIEVVPKTEEGPVVAGMGMDADEEEMADPNGSAMDVTADTLSYIDPNGSAMEVDEKERQVTAAVPTGGWVFRPILVFGPAGRTTAVPEPKLPGNQQTPSFSASVHAVRPIDEWPIDECPTKKLLHETVKSAPFFYGHARLVFYEIPPMLVGSKSTTHKDELFKGTAYRFECFEGDEQPSFPLDTTQAVKVDFSYHRTSNKTPKARPPKARTPKTPKARPSKVSKTSDKTSEPKASPSNPIAFRAALVCKYTFEIHAISALIIMKPRTTDALRETLAYQAIEAATSGEPAPVTLDASEMKKILFHGTMADRISAPQSMELDPRWEDLRGSLREHLYPWQKFQ